MNRNEYVAAAVEGVWKAPSVAAGIQALSTLEGQILQKHRLTSDERRAAAALTVSRAKRKVAQTVMGIMVAEDFMPAVLETIQRTGTPRTTTPIPPTNGSSVLSTRWQDYSGSFYRFIDSVATWPLGASERLVRDMQSPGSKQERFRIIAQSAHDSYITSETQQGLSFTFPTDPDFTVDWYNSITENTGTIGKILLGCSVSYKNGKQSPVSLKELSGHITHLYRWVHGDSLVSVGAKCHSRSQVMPIS